MRRPLLIISLFIMLLASTNLLADTFNFSYSGSGVSARGVLTTDPEASGSFLITSITGNRNGVNISSLLAVGTFGANDNLLYPTPPLLDLPGFSFVAGGIDYNVAYYAGGKFGVAGYYDSPDETFTARTTLVDFTATPVPEPSSLLFLGSGIVGTIGAARKRLFRF